MPAASSGTVLVLEANTAVLELIDQALRDSGHRVLSTQEALEAVDLMRRIRIDVVVVGDLQGRRRETLLGALRAIQPGLHVVSTRAEDDELDEIGRATRLASPFSIDDLREAVAAGLHGRRDPSPSPGR